MESSAKTGVLVHSERLRRAAMPFRQLRPGRWIMGAGRLLEALANASIGVLCGLWLGSVLGCGLVYWLMDLVQLSGLREGGAAVAANLDGLGTAIYFSFVTATSVGYGDVVPVGWARVLASAESAWALLIFGCLISKLVSRRQEQLVEEIALLAFEDRLGRVRTNLHMVLADLQSIASECSPATVPPERLLPRVESAVMVFAGELRAVHDLLYRPQRIPEEAVLEAILANLATGLRGFGDLLNTGLGPAYQSVVLLAGLASIRGLAEGICGECVPRQYAPALKVWMDRINDLAKRLAPVQR